jgi:glutaredoxin-related protein
LTKLDENGVVIFHRSYPGIFQNSVNGYLYDYAIPRSIEVKYDKVYVTGEAMQFYPGSNSVGRCQTFFAKFDSDGNLISLEFLGDKSAISRVVKFGSNYYVVRQELVNEGNAILTKTKIYFKENFEAIPVLCFENNSVMDELQKSMWRVIETTEGLLILADNSDYHSLGAKLIMYDVVSNTVMWQKSYLLDIDSSTVNISSTMGNIKELIQMPDLGYAFSGSVLTNNMVYPWYIRTDACGDVVYSGCTISGVEEQAGKKEVELIGYPNPFTSNLTLQFNCKELPVNIQIFNSVGQGVHTEAVNGRQQLTLNTESFATGVYVVRAADSSLTETFVKE